MRADHRRLVHRWNIVSYFNKVISLVTTNLNTLITTLPHYHHYPSTLVGAFVILQLILSLVLLRVMCFIIGEQFQKAFLMILR